MPLRNAVLDELYAADGGVTTRGRPEAVPSHIQRRYAEALYEVVRQRRPRRVLEVGMAFGASSLAIAQALEDNGDGALTSVDPGQASFYGNAALTNLERSGLAHRHVMHDDYDYVVLPALLAAGERFELVYVDGSHAFDFAFLDLFYADRLLGDGGVVGVNDCGMPAVHNALLGFLAHRDYAELDVGLAKEYADADARRADRSWADRYFEKRSDRLPGWDAWSDFWVPPGRYAPRLAALRQVAAAALRRGRR